MTDLVVQALRELSASHRALLDEIRRVSKPPPTATPLSGAPNDFVVDAGSLLPFRLDLSLARAQPVRFPLSGSFLWCPESSGIGANCSVSLQDRSPGSNAIPFGKGAVIRGVKFKEVWITNTAQAGAWLLLIYTARLSNDVAVASPSALFTNVTATLTQGSTVKSGSGSIGAVDTLLLAADATRRSVTIKNTHAGQTLKITGGEGADITKYTLNPSESYTFSASAASSFRGIGGGAATTFDWIAEFN